jgi:RNA polymerase sigma-70 factor (ECF subfamily)
MISSLRRFFGDNEAHAEDVCQQTFMRIFECRDQYDPSRSFISWLYSIMSNTAIDYKRHGARMYRAAVAFSEMPDTADRTSGEPVSFDPTDDGVDPEESAAIHETAARVREIADALDEPDRLLIEMVYFNSASYPEAAQALGLTVNATRVRLSRLLKSLRSSLRGEIKLLVA